MDVCVACRSAPIHIVAVDDFTPALLVAAADGVPPGRELGQSDTRRQIPPFRALSLKWKINSTTVFEHGCKLFSLEFVQFLYFVISLTSRSTMLIGRSRYNS